MSVLKSHKQGSSIVFWLWQFYLFTVWLLAPSISFCFTFVLFQSMPSSWNRSCSFHPPQPNIRPPRVLWTGLWHNRWSHTEDMGHIPNRLMGNVSLRTNGIESYTCSTHIHVMMYVKTTTTTQYFCLINLQWCMPMLLFVVLTSVSNEVFQPQC